MTAIVDDLRDEIRETRAAMKRGQLSPLATSYARTDLTEYKQAAASVIHSVTDRSWIDAFFKLSLPANGSFRR